MHTDLFDNDFSSLASIIARWNNRNLFSQMRKNPYKTDILTAEFPIHSFASSKLSPYSVFCNPTTAVNLFHVGKQYLAFCRAKAAVTRNLIGRKIISSVERSDTRNPF